MGSSGIGMAGVSKVQGPPGPGSPGHGEGASDLPAPVSPGSRPAGARPRSSPRPSARLPARFQPTAPGPAAHDSPLPPGHSPRRSRDPLSAASNATGSASPATAALRAAAVQSAPSERVPVRSPEARLGWAAAARGRPRTRHRSRCALEAASAWSRRDPLCPRFCFWLHHELPSSPSPWCGLRAMFPILVSPRPTPYSIISQFPGSYIVSILSFIHSNHCFPKCGIWHHWGYKAILGGTRAMT